MNKTHSLTALLVSAGLASGASILSPGDFIIAIDQDPPGSNSSYPGGETPANALDGDAGTKYLNFGQAGSGLIFTPTGGSSTVQSIEWTTANDAVERDPASFSFFGTNDPITSLDNSTGLSENWTLITTDTVSLPAGRGVGGTFSSFTNLSSFTSFRIVMDTVADGGIANSMQIADLNFFTGTGGTGTSILSSGVSQTIAIHNNFDSRYPTAEGPNELIDGVTTTKYLNFGGDGSGVIVTPGASTVRGIELTTGNDTASFPDRNPTSYTIYGTNDPITSQDNSQGDAENWILIESGALSLASANFTSSGILGIDNDTEYASYKIIFEGSGGIMQLSELQLHTVPEPSSALLILLGAAGLIRRHR